MARTRIAAVEWAELEGRRPRSAGCNARLGVHGQTVRTPLARLTTDDGATGFGYCRATEEQILDVLGQQLDALFDVQYGATPAGQFFDYPLWDLMAKRGGQPVYRLAAGMAGKPAHEPLRVSCYDTSLYMDDLHLASDEAAASLLAEETREGLARGQRAFKIKVGRGARHMPLEEGTRRDIAVIRAVRGAAGEESVVMLDANNGYNLNLAKRVLAETADCRIHWLEEAFHEDRVLYEDLQAWLRAEGLPVLIADGEGEASPSLLAWAQAGVVNVIQYDILSYGFSGWLALGAKLDRWGVQTAPHHYGRHIGNYATCHLAGAVSHFAFVEWDETATPGFAGDGYAIEEGKVVVPDSPGFGLTLDEEVFAQVVAARGIAHAL